MQIRPGRADDADFLTEANARMAQETEGLALDCGILSAGVCAALADPAKARYFVAERNGERAGALMVTWEWSDWRNGVIWWIQSVYVAPHFRRRGVFSALYSHVRAAAREAGAAGGRLYVDRDNATGQKTYRALGMELTGYLVMEEMF